MTQSGLYSIVYRSHATRLYSTDELAHLLEEAHQSNAQAGITGILLYGDNCFVQYVEGPEDVVKSLVERISADTRHKNLKVLEAARIQTRAFHDWSMAFRHLPDGWEAELEAKGEQDKHTAIAEILELDVQTVPMVMLRAMARALR